MNWIQGWIYLLYAACLFEKNIHMFPCYVISVYQNMHCGWYSLLWTTKANWSYVVNIMINDGHGHNKYAMLYQAMILTLLDQNN